MGMHYQTTGLNICDNAVTTITAATHPPHKSYKT